MLPSEAYQRWHDRFIRELFGHVPSPVRIAYDFWIGGTIAPRSFDLSNAVESINDLLVDAGVIAGDSWADVVEMSPRVAGFIRGEPRTIVVVEAVNRSWYSPVQGLRDVKARSDALGCSQKQVRDQLWETIAGQ